MNELTVEKLEQILDEKFEQQAQLINNAFQEQKDHFDERLDKLEKRMEKLEHEMAALTAKVTAHLDLSDKRYLELKRRDIVIAKWIKKIADKSGVDIDLAELEKF